MTNNEKDNIMRVINLLNKMYKIIDSSYNQDVIYAKKNIVKIVTYLEEELISDTVGYKELINTVLEPYKRMFPPRGGLSDFHIWDNDYQVRYKANNEYEQIKKQIEEILNLEKIL